MTNLKLTSKQNGQSLVEVVVALSVAAVIITALLIVVITSLRNAQLSQTQSRATKYAQEGLEKVRAIRDRDGTVSSLTIASQANSSSRSCTSGIPTKFSDLYCNNLANICPSAPSGSGLTGNVCYFKLDANNLSLTYAPGPANLAEDIMDGTTKTGLTREVIIFDNNSPDPNAYKNEKQVIVKVKWNDSAGPHESNLQTILTKQ